MAAFQTLIAQNGQAISVCAGGHLFRQGEADSNVYFVKSGILKAYYIRIDGKEHLKSFQPEGAIIGSMVALIDREPSTFNLMALEDSEVIALPYAKLESAARSDIDLANTLIEFLSAYGKRKERREYELLSLTPEARYEIAVETMPHVVGRVSQADLAAYIGVTPQALSRIKRRISRQSG